MKLSSLIYAGLVICMGMSIPKAYGQKDVVDSLPPSKPGSEAQASQLYFDAIKAKMHDDNKMATWMLEQFIAIKPDVPAAYYELAAINYNDKNLEEADKYIQKALKLSPGNKWYKEERASILAEKGQYVEAAAIMAELSKSEPQDRTYALIAAEYYNRARRYEDAITYLDVAIARNGPDAEILMRKVQVYMTMEKVEKAAATMRQIIAQEPDNGKYYKLLGELYDNQKMPDKAKEVYEEAKKALPGDPFVLLGVAEHYLKMGDTTAYISNARTAILNSDFDADTQLDILKAFLQTMPNDSVVAVNGLPIIRQIAVQHPDDAEVLVFYGDMLEISRKPDSSMVMYKRSVALKPGNFNVWEIVLRKYTPVKDADSLIRYSEKAMRLFPNQALVHYFNGIGHMNKKEYPAAAKALNRAIDLQPENNRQVVVGMYSVLAEIYHLNKQDDLSDKAFDKAIQILPNEPSILNNYSYYLSVRGVRLDDAERMSKKSLELSPHEATFLDTYGWIWYRKGDYEKAKQYIQQAIELAGVNADATLYDHMGNVWYKLNDKEKAVQYWKLSKEKGGDDPQLDKKINEGKLYE